MKLRLYAFLLAMALSMPSQAAMVYGAPDCGEWMKDTPQRKELYKSWLMGFMSGLNLDGRGKDALSKISSAKQMFLWMDNYCRTNPLESLSDGGQILMMELKAK